MWFINQAIKKNTNHNYDSDAYCLCDGVLRRDVFCCSVSILSPVLHRLTSHISFSRKISERIQNHVINGS